MSEASIPMDDKLLFAKILGLRPPWFIKQVMVDDQAQRVDIYVEHEPDVRGPVCDTLYGLYDHAPERVRHLNTCQMQTNIHVRPPRVNCPNHGVKQIGSEISFSFESFVIRVAQE